MPSRYQFFVVNLVNLFGQVGLSYQQKLRDGITLTLSTAIDGTKLNEPGHKVGLALEMEA
jgi:hypothetical protein